MTEQENQLLKKIIDTNLSAGEKEELLAIGILSNAGSILPSVDAAYPDGYARLEKSAMRAENVLNEATCYGSAFARGLKLELGNYKLLIKIGRAHV